MELRNTSLRTEQTSISCQQVTWPYNGAISPDFLPVYDNACTVSWVTNVLLMFTDLLLSVIKPDFNLGHQAHNIKIAIETPPSLTIAQVTGLFVQFESAPTPTNSWIYIFSVCKGMIYYNGTSGVSLNVKWMWSSKITRKVLWNDHVPQATNGGLLKVRQKHLI